MKLPVLPALLALAIVHPHAAVFAQAAPPVQVGARVRVSTVEAAPGHFRAERWVVGTVREANGDELVLRVAGAGEQSALSIPWSAVQRMEISRGTLSSRDALDHGMKRIVLPSFVIGGAAGAVFRMIDQGIQHHDRPPSTATYAAIGAGVVGAAGMVATLATASGGGEQWEAVPTAKLRPAVVIRPGGGVGVVMRLRF